MFSRKPSSSVGLVALLFATALLLFSTDSALAVQTHILVKTFGGAANVSGANGVAIDPTSGEVYVSDPGNNVVEKFDPTTGALDTSFGDTSGASDGRLAGTETLNKAFAGTQAVAVDPGSGDLYVVDPGHGLVAKFDAKGKLIAGFGESGQISLTAIPSGTPGSVDTGGPFMPWAVAVDPGSGDLYATDLANSTVDKFDAKGKFISQVDVSGTVPGPSGLAVDSAGNVYVVGSGSVEKFNGSGEDQGPVDQSGANQGVGVDLTSGDVYFAQGSQVAQFSGSAWVGSFGQVGTTHVQNANSVAIDSSGHLFVADNGAPESEKAIFEFGTAVATAAPVVVNEAPSAVTTTTAHLSGTVNPEGWDTTWHFEYSTNHASWTPIPSPDQDAGSGASAVAVSADPSGLQPNTHYFVRLVASNGLDPAVVSGEQGFTTDVKLPSVANDAPIFNLTATTGTLRSNVDPYNAALSSCRFEYGTDTSYGASVPCAQDAGTGHEFVSVSADLSGLQPGATYHFRLDTANAAGQSQGSDASFTTPNPQSPTCPNAFLRTGLAANLPNCRAYEMVSPVEKGGSDVWVQSTRIRVSSDGDGVLFPSIGSFADVHGTGEITEYVAERGADGWATHNVFPQTPQQGFNTLTAEISQGYMQTKADLSAGIYGSPFPLTDDPSTNNVGNFYLRDDLLAPGNGSYKLLTGCPLCMAAGGSPLPSPEIPTAWAAYHNLDGASADLSHIIFESRRNLTSDAPGNCEGELIESCPIKLYESVNGAVHLAGVLPDGSPAQGSVSGAGGAPSIPSPNTISRDGSRVIFTDTSTRNVYMRVDGTSTVQINASERTDCADHQPCANTPEPDPNGSQPAEYWDASADGSRLFFTSGEALNNEISADFPSFAKMYVYDANAAPGHHLSLIEPPNVAGSAAGEVLGVSADGHYLYFTWFNARLVGGQTPVPSGETPIYVWHDGVIRFIATTNTSDYVENNVNRRGVGGESDATQSRVTPDGRHLLFTSSSATSPTGLQQNSHLELYLYGAADNDLTCVSCNRSGAPSSAAGVVGAIDPHINGVRETEYLPHALSDDGRFVFFTTAARLVPQDSNGVRDAYEYDSQTGQVHLLSSGTDPSSSFFVDADPDGSNIVISTHQHLVGQDVDQLADLYDVRIDGGIAAQSPAAASPPCADAEGCHGAPSGQPGGVGLASSSFVGSGNVTSPGTQSPPGSAAGSRLRISGKAGRVSVALTLRVPAAGRITVTGNGLGRRVIAASKAGSYRLTIGLNAAARKALRTRHRVKVLVRVAYAPATGPASFTKLVLTVKA